MKVLTWSIGIFFLFTLDVRAGPTGDALAEGFKKMKGPAIATVAIKPHKWIYTVTNNAPMGSGLMVNSFNFDLYGLARAINVPLGWTVDTDGKEFVLWTAEKGGIGPGESLAFELESDLQKSKEAYGMMLTRDTKLGKAGPTSASVLKIPSSK